MLKPCIFSTLSAPSSMFIEANVIYLIQKSSSHHKMPIAKLQQRRQSPKRLKVFLPPFFVCLQFSAHSKGSNYAKL